MKFVYFSKTWSENSNLIKTWQEWRVFYIKTSTHVWSKLAQFFLEIEMCRTNVVEKIKFTFTLKKFLPNKHNIEARSWNHYCSGMRSKCYILWVCVCSLRHRAWNSHAPCFHLWRPALPYFSTLSHTRHDFRKKILSMKSVLWFSLLLLSDMFLILSRIKWDAIKNLYCSSCKVTVIFVRF